MANKREKGWLYPLNPDPPQFGVCVPIPDDENHIRAFLGAIRELGIARNWQWTETDPSRASRVWSDIFDVVSQRIGVEFCDEGETGRCRSYPNTASFIQYYPNDPRYTPDLVTDGYNSPAWYFATTASNLAYGTQPGDVVTSLDRFPPGSLPTIIPASGLPRVRIPVNLVPGGIVRTYWRNMIAGSILQVTVDDNPLTADFIDLNKDLVALPWETHPQVIHEYVSEDGGQHHLDYIIVSQVNDAIPFLHHGGGLIRVEICGELDGDGMDCCDLVIQLNTQLIQFNEYNQNNTNITIYDGTPGSVNPSAPPIQITGGDNHDLRRTALCLALTRYTGNILRANFIAGCGVGILAGLTTLAGGWLLGGPLGGVVGGVALGTAIGNCVNLLNVVNDPQAQQDLICALYEAFQGMELTHQNFQDIWANITPPTPEVGDMLTVIASAPVLQNYLYFLDLLGAGYDQAVAGAGNDCEDCVPPACGPFDYRISGYEGYFGTYGVPFSGSRKQGTGLLNSTFFDNRWNVVYFHPIDCEMPNSNPTMFFTMTYETLRSDAVNATAIVHVADGLGVSGGTPPFGMSNVIGVHQWASNINNLVNTHGLTLPAVRLGVRCVNSTQANSHAIRSMAISFG